MDVRVLVASLAYKEALLDLLATPYSLWRSQSHHFYQRQYYYYLIQQHSVVNLLLNFEVLSKK